MLAMIFTTPIYALQCNEELSIVKSSSYVLPDLVDLSIISVAEGAAFLHNGEQKSVKCKRKKGDTMSASSP